MTKAQCRKAQVPPKLAGPEARHCCRSRKEYGTQIREERHHWTSCVTRRCRRSRSSENPNGIHKGSGLSKPLRQLPDEGESGQTGADDHQPFGEQHSTCVVVVEGRAVGAELTVPELVGEKSPSETNRRAEDQCGQAIPRFRWPIGQQIFPSAQSHGEHEEPEKAAKETEDHKEDFIFEVFHRCNGRR